MSAVGPTSSVVKGVGAVIIGSDESTSNSPAPKVPSSLSTAEPVAYYWLPDQVLASSLA